MFENKSKFLQTTALTMAVVSGVGGLMAATGPVKYNAEQNTDNADVSGAEYKNQAAEEAKVDIENPQNNVLQEAAPAQESAQIQEGPFQMETDYAKDEQVMVRLSSMQVQEKSTAYAGKSMYDKAPDDIVLAQKVYRDLFVPTGDMHQEISNYQELPGSVDPDRVVEDKTIFEVAPAVTKDWAQQRLQNTFNTVSEKFPETMKADQLVRCDKPMGTTTMTCRTDPGFKM